MDSIPTPNQPPVMSIVEASDGAGMSTVVSAIAAALYNAATTMCLISELDKLPPPYPSASVDTARLHRHFKPQIDNMVQCGATVVQAGEFSAVAIWEPPGFIDGRPNDPSIPIGPALMEWRDQIKAIKKQYLSEPEDKNSETAASNGIMTERKIRPFWHLALLARNPHVPVAPGAISAVVRPFLERARKENVPAWLESISLSSARIYEHYGFRTVAEIKLGVGRCDERGWPQEGGVGTTAYAMIYDGHLRETLN